MHIVVFVSHVAIQCMALQFVHMLLVDTVLNRKSFDRPAQAPRRERLDFSFLWPDALLRD